MTHRIVALYHNPWPILTLERPNFRKPVELYRYAVCYKANPRTADYMRTLLVESYPAAEWVSTADQADWPIRVASADKVVLLYPDAIGLGFDQIERTLLRSKRAWAGVFVLNGRHRGFLLNRATRVGLMCRRFLAWTMLPELFFLPVYIVVTPLLWAIDFLRGRT